MKRSHLLYFYGVVFIGFCLFGIAVAQIQPTPTDNLAQQQLANMKNQLDFLKDMQRHYPDPTLASLIEQAEKHMLAAEQAHQKKQNFRAYNEYKLARNIINKALKIIIAGPAGRLIEQVNEKIRLAEQLLLNNFNPQAQKLLENAKESRKRAAQFKDRNVQKMVEWLRLASFQVDNALKMISPSDVGMNLLNAIHEEKANYEDLLQRAQNMLQQNRINLAQQLFKQAIVQFEKAESANARGNLKQAIDSYRWASRLLLRVIDLSGESEINWKRQAREELEVTREMLRSLKQVRELNQNRRIQNLIQQATKVYLDGEHSFSQKNFPDAVRKAELARRVLNRASQLIEKRPGRIGFQFDQEYNLVVSLLNHLEQEFEPDRNPAAQKIFETAQAYLQRSQTQYRQNRQFPARANLYLATRFAYGLRALLQDGQRTGNLEALAIKAFDNFQRRYLQIKDQFGASKDRKINIWLTLAKDIYSISLTAKNSGQFRILYENVRIGQQILDRIEG